MQNNTSTIPNPPTLTRSQIVKACLVCFASSLFFFYEFFQLNMFNSINQALLKEFHFSAEQLGRLSAYYFYANVLFLFPAGLILDRVSTRKALLVAMLTAVSCTTVFAHTSTIWVADLCRFLTGISSTFAFLSCLRLASRWFPTKYLALVIGLIVTIAMLGGMVAQTPMTVLTDALGWRNALRIAAGFGLVLWLLIFLFVQDYPENGEQSLNKYHKPLTTTRLWTSLKRAFINRQNWLSGVYTSLMNLPIFLLGAMWGSLYLVQIHHLTDTQASEIVSMIFVGTIVGAPAIGLLSDRLGRRKLPMIVFSILSLAVIFPIIYLPQITPAIGMLLFFLLGFFTSSQVISYPVIAESNPLEITATASAIASVLIMGGGVMQPVFGWFMGLHWDHHLLNGVPLYSLSDYRLALWMMPIAFLIALLATLPLKETRCMAQEFKS
ncbi:MAG TPA: MFS transporter [Gammaproteobacteria bacterium]|nr:MFS transporter [Gammaproteobacteria bacterium]